MVFPRAEHSNSLLYQMASPESVHKSNIIWTQMVIFRKICAYRRTHAIAVEENGHEFEGESGDMCWWVWTEERERRNVVIML